MLDCELAEPLVGIAVGVERVDLRRGGGVFVGDGLVCDARVGECHAQAAMAEHRRDRFETHPPIDRLSRERVTELVGMHVSESGGAGDPPDDPADVMTVERSAVTVEQISVDGWMGGRPVREEPLRVRMQRDATIVVQLPDRDPQPWRPVQRENRVGSEAAELTDAHPSPRQQLDDQPIERRRDCGLGREAGGLRVVQEPRQRIVRDGDINREDRSSGRRVEPVPFDNPIEETAEHPEPLPDRVPSRHDTLDREVRREERLEALDVGAPDVDEPGHITVSCDEITGEAPQRVVGHIDGCGP
jgi:hypothetical protein